MRKNWFLNWKMATALCLLCVAPLVWAKVQPIDPESLEPNSDHRRAAAIIIRVVDAYHYHPRDLDDALSEEILRRYLDLLDPSRSFFTIKDVENIDLYKDRLDDALKRSALQPAFNIFKLHRTRVERRIDRVLKRLQQPFDYTLDESWQLDRSEAEWAKNEAELDEIWRKRLKGELLSLRLSGKEEDKALETLQKRYTNLRNRIEQMDSNDVFQTFMLAYTQSIEPHTAYMSPRASENFDINMSLSLEGVGLVLKTEDEYTVVERVVPGGPADENGQISRDFKIIGVAQGTDGEIEDIIGWRLQDVVQKIRGKKGSIVRLEVIPAGAVQKHKLVKLERNKIKLEDQAAKAQVIDIEDKEGDMRIGVIDIPAFYRDFQAEMDGDKNFRSTTRDVKKLLLDLKKQNVDGIVIDLRNNGGGSLTEATSLTGLFIKRGPVVQVKDSQGELEIERDTDSSVAWDGPLAILVNRNSASASEILAGAIQDYQRGLIIGEPTFGKGTVQTLIDLNRFSRSADEPLGRLRLTMAQFFRVSGASTQYRGVVPDILYPMMITDDESGERSLDNAIPWARVSHLKHDKSSLMGISNVREKHYKRIEKEPGFDFLISEARLIKDINDQESMSVNEEKRKRSWDLREHKQLQIRNTYRIARGLKPLSKEELENKDHDEDEAEADAIELIQSREAAHILADQIRLTRGMTVSAN
ncbi:MAG: carboxy terminal-processing peptidase [gamma proteobacterium symbiont of Bathyaustriella thionipta]|nr:carboxy terminal-processing peptidase [gamma proteobacterium symbiont of Bathyaustriella thionipta]